MSTGGGGHCLSQVQFKREEQWPHVSAGHFSAQWTQSIPPTPRVRFTLEVNKRKGAGNHAPPIPRFNMGMKFSQLENKAKPSSRRFPNTWWEY